MKIHPAQAADQTSFDDRWPSLPALVAQRAAEAPDRPFLVMVDGPVHTYGQVHWTAMKWATAFEQRGVAKGDLVLTMQAPGLDSLAAWLGLSWIGATAVPVNLQFRGALLRDVIRICAAKAAVVDEVHLSTLIEMLEPSDMPAGVLVSGTEVLLDQQSRLFSARELVTEAIPDIGEREAPAAWDLATVLFTSGTTGAPKGVLIPWGQLTATSLANAGTLGPEDAYYSPFPWFHISGLGPLTLMAYVGGRVVLREGFSASSFWSDVRRHGITATVLFAAVVHYLLAAPPADDDSDNPLTSVIMVPVIPESDEFARRFGISDYTTSYNSSEMSCPFVHEPGATPKPGVVGRPRDGYSVRLVDEVDREVPAGTAGELVVRTDEPWLLMQGYLHEPEATTAAFRNLWLHTGDTFVCDADGDYRFVDRCRDVIRRRGENVSSMVVESHARQVPGVLDCAAVAVPSEYGEDDILLIAVTEPGVEITESALTDALETTLPTYMVPRYVEFVDELPMTATQKVRKAVLRDRGLTDRTWTRTL